MTPVTVRRKRYVVPCVVCRDLYPAFRTDSRTCSTACRVALHRGHVDTYALAAEDVAKAFGSPVDPFDVRRVDSLRRLRPDLVVDVKRGGLGLDAVDLWPEFWSAIRADLEENH